MFTKQESAAIEHLVGAIRKGHFNLITGDECLAMGRYCGLVLGLKLKIDKLIAEEIIKEKLGGTIKPLDKKPKKENKDDGKTKTKTGAKKSRPKGDGKTADERKTSS